MKNKLKAIFQIQEVLKKSSYYDISRISQEVYDFSQDNNIPLEDIFKRLKDQEPWEYIKGNTDFRNNTFLLNSSTLIPRIETEGIVDLALKELKNGSQYQNIIDVGTGSGCIIISLAKELDNNKYSYWGTDISNYALEIAKTNESNILKSKRISWVSTNLIENIKLDENAETLIIANLPYIPTDQYFKLDRSVKDFEPKEALDGGEDGIKYYIELITQIKEKGIKGLGIFEIEPSTLSEFKRFNPAVKKDLYGRDRFVLIRFC